MVKNIIYVSNITISQKKHRHRKNVIKHSYESTSKYWLAILIDGKTCYQVVRDKIKEKYFVKDNFIAIVNFIKGK